MSRTKIPGTTLMVNPWQFIKEAKTELLKVVWPTRSETVRVTIAVIILCVIMAIILGAADYGLTQLIEYGLSRN